MTLASKACLYFFGGSVSIWIFDLQILWKTRLKQGEEPRTA